MANFQWERLVMALGAVGAMRRTLELAVRAEAGRALTYHALRAFIAGRDAVREVTMAKLAIQRANFELQDECLRLIGRDPGTRARHARREARPDRRRDR